MALESSQDGVGWGLWRERDPHSMQGAGLGVAIPHDYSGSVCRQSDVFPKSSSAR